MNFPVLSLTIFIPVAAAIAIAFLPGARQREAKWVALAAGLLVFLLALYILINYDYASGGYQFEERYRWMDDLGISFHLAVDGISVPMVLLTSIIIFAGVFISWRVHWRSRDFFILLLLLVSGVFGVFVSLDLFFLFFFYELAVLPMYLLIGVWGSSSDFGTFVRTKEYGAMKLMIYLVAGSVLVWLALIAVYVESGVGSFDLLTLQDVGFTPFFQRVFFPFFLLGFGVLAGLWPFHTWSPDGHVAAPTAVSMLHAGVLMKLGAYGIIRVGMTLMPEGAQTWMPLLAVLGTVNIIYGAISAMAQTDLKYVVGYSSVSHMGYVLLGLATLSLVGINGAVLQMFSHGIMTALMFALVGFIYDKAHTRDIGVLEGLAKRIGFTAVLFTIAGLASLGLPGLSGFVAELLVLIGTFQTYPLLGVLGVLGATLTAIYILRLLGKVFFGPLNPRWQGLTEAGKIEGFAAAFLALFLIVVGVYPLFLLRVIDSGVMPLIIWVGGVL